MEDSKVEVVCEECGIAFSMLAGRYEKAMENEEAILCENCCAFFLEEQEKAAEPKQRKFEYMLSAALELNTWGNEGWEAVGIFVDDMVLLKKEIL